MFRSLTCAILPAPTATISCTSSTSIWTYISKIPNKLVYKAKAEKYAKIISKTIILSGMDAASFGQNAYFYDAAEGLLTATILLGGRVL